MYRTLLPLQCSLSIICKQTLVVFRCSNEIIVFCVSANLSLTVLMLCPGKFAQMHKLYKIQRARSLDSL